MRIKVFRGDPESSRYDSFDLRPSPDMTVLSALFQVQDEQDPSISFRYSCRGACCGACAVLVNKVPRLACRTQLRKLLSGSDPINLKPYPAVEGGEGWDAGSEVLIEPLPHLPVIKDLVVDMKPFFQAYEAVKPYFHPAGEHPEKERRMDPAVVEELVQYANCFLCASCYGACPPLEEHPFKGPAALAKLYRFAADPREGREEERLRAGDGEDGWAGCGFHLNCSVVCPMNVPQNMAIGKARQKLMSLGRH